MMRRAITTAITDVIDTGSGEGEFLYQIWRSEEVEFCDRCRTPRISSPLGYLRCVCYRWHMVLSDPQVGKGRQPTISVEV